MAKTLEQILGAKNLIGTIQGIKAGVPDDLVPQAMLTPTRAEEGNRATYTKVEGTRQTARIAMYGSPSQRTNLKGVSEVPITLLHTIEHIVHKPTTLMNLRNLDNESKQKLGMAEIARATKDFKQRFINLRVSAVYSMLTKGAIYFDSNGNLLPSSSGATVTVDFGVPAGNKNQLDVFGSGAIISASWATANTNIIKQVSDIKKAARKLTGYPLRYAFYGANILDYFLTNTKLKEIINRAPAYQQAFSQGEIADGLLGLNWRPLYEAFFADKDGTLQDWCGDDQVIFTPEPSPDWYEFIEGTYPVPTDLGKVSNSSEAALGNVVEVAGMFTYARLLDDPVTIKQIAGDTFLPVLKVPKAIFIADVTP